jgi:NAD(P)H dehydrogenase (quinone)
MSETLLVTGAAGHLGRVVLDALLDSGVEPGSIVAATRDVAKLSGYAARGVAVRRADFDDPASLDAAFAGVTKVLIISTDALDRPGRRLEQHLVAVAAAKKAGVRHLLYTSMPQPDDSRVSFAPDHLGTENAVKATGIPYTIFRNGWYFENLFYALPQALETGRWFTSAGQGRTAYAARADFGAAIAAGLRAAGAQSRTYTLTGAVTHSADEVATAVTAATGRPLEVVHVSDEQLAGGLVAAGLPAAVVQVFVSFDAAAREGQLSAVTNDMEALSGRKPTTLATFLEANKAVFGG